jgi:hypothetical protein
MWKASRKLVGSGPIAISFLGNADNMGKSIKTKIKTLAFYLSDVALNTT